MSNSRGERRRRALRQRLVELRNQIYEVTGGECEFGPAGEGLTLEKEIAFLEQVLAFESAPDTTWGERLLSAGYRPPDPDGLTDEELGLELWRMIQHLSELGLFMTHTNHLSDRELYRWLQREILPTETKDAPAETTGASVVDPIEAGTDEDLACWLRYYASDLDRSYWREDFPDLPIPPREQPGYQRDHLLPQPNPMSDPLTQWLNRLLEAAWLEADAPIRLAGDLPAADVAGLRVVATARAILAALGEQGPVKAAPKGLLPPPLVADILGRLPATPGIEGGLPSPQRGEQETEVALLHAMRLACQKAHLLRKRKGNYALTRDGEAMLDPDRAGALYRRLFDAYFDHVDFNRFDDLPPWETAQGTIPIILWQLSEMGTDWLTQGQIATEVLHSMVVEEFRAEAPADADLAGALRVRLLRHLVEFGLLEPQPDPDPGAPARYRTTDLFRRFLAFDDPGLD